MPRGRLLPAKRGRHCEQTLPLIRYRGGPGGHAWPPERPRWHPKLFDLVCASLEVESLGEIVGGGIARREGVEPPAPLDHAKHGRVIQYDTRHRSAAGIRRDDKARHAESAQPVLIACRLV